MRYIRRKHPLKKLCLIVLGGLITVFIVFPVLYMLLSALMKPDEISRYYTPDAMAFHMLPDTISLNAFYQVLFRRPDYLLKFWYSLLISGAVRVRKIQLSRQACGVLRAHRAHTAASARDPRPELYRL
jgi:multiple sugar transport system permease protein